MLSLEQIRARWTNFKIKTREKTIEGRKVNIVPLFVKEVGEINAQG